MKKLLVKKNTTIKTPLGRAELYYQTVFADHLVENYQKDLQINPAKRHHDLVFSDIDQLLKGNVSMKVIPGKEGQIEAVSFYRGRHYFTCFHVAKRPTLTQHLPSSLPAMPQTKENTSTDTKSTSSSSRKRSAVEPGDYFIDGKGRMYVLDANRQPIRYTPPK